MFDEFDFHLDQLRSIRAVMTDIPSFQPDGSTTATVSAQITEAETVRGDFQTQVSTIAIARGELKEIATTVHNLCVQVYAIMKSRYRQDPGSYDAISKLPIEDDSPLETFQRGQAMSKLWAILPNPPGSITPFKAWDTMGRTEFDAELTALETKLNGMAAIEQSYERVQGEFRAMRNTLSAFATAALVQGRGQFRKGTQEREQIDAIPTESSPKPSKAVIENAVSPGPGQALIKFKADHATSFRVLRKGPGQSSYSFLADVGIGDTYHDSGLTAGTWGYIVQGRNSRGFGPDSEAAAIDVQGA